MVKSSTTLNQEYKGGKTQPETFAVRRGCVPHECKINYSILRGDNNFRQLKCQIIKKDMPSPGVYRNHISVPFSLRECVCVMLMKARLTELLR